MQANYRITYYFLLKIKKIDAIYTDKLFNKQITSF